MNRLGTAEERANALLTLAFNAVSGYVTVQIIEINGGRLCSSPQPGRRSLPIRQ